MGGSPQLWEKRSAGEEQPPHLKNYEVSFWCDCKERNKILTFSSPLQLDIANFDRGEEWGGASSVGRRHPKEVGCL